jgi:hypothetical protein
MFYITCPFEKGAGESAVFLKVLAVKKVLENRRLVL